jgi:branched-chain amino acid aminotransferase
LVTKKGTHDYDPDPRNDDVLVYVNGELFPKAKAMVNVLDSGFVFGDGVWEGFRLHRGKLLFANQHFKRLFAGAKAIHLNIGKTALELEQAILETVRANEMESGVHVRLMVTRGVRSTPYQDPRVVVGAPTIVIIAEHKAPLSHTVEHGIRLFTVHVRRGAPDVQDPKLNSHSKLNCILACIQATEAGADEALMLDPHGFVATCNSTHFFVVVDGEVWTSTGRYCLGGITRSAILRICTEEGVGHHERDFSLTDVYAADEAFVTGTFAGVVPVVEVDGRQIGQGARGALTKRLQDQYQNLVERCSR